MSLIEELKNLRKKAEKLSNDNKVKIDNNDNVDSIIKYYKDSMSIGKATTGRVMIITEDGVYAKDAPNNTSHKNVASFLLENEINNPLQLDGYDGDYGEIISDAGYVFIRMCSIVNGVSIINYPHVCNSYQINELKKFNGSVKEFNEDSEYKTNFVYNGENGEKEEENLDKLISKLEERLSRQEPENNPIAM